MATTCGCGHAFDHHMVTAEGEYGVLGWLLMIIGATPTPVRIKYRCRRCDQVFLVTEDPAVRRANL